MLAAYAFMMMAMGFLHQPVAGVSALSSAIQQATGNGHLRLQVQADAEAPAIAHHIAMGHMPAQHGEADPHKLHHRNLCDACLANAGHAPPPEAPALDKPEALAKSARIVLAALVLKEAGTRIAQPRAPPAFQTA